ncbi:hypothetical protein F5B21DRAFT_473482 [Xylaria acuta]|nr:hypothetical protein F5B21DRAFT_473482 [Xylaria acuta]
MDWEFPNNTTPTSPAPQEPEEIPPEESKSCHELQSQILKVLEQLRDNQRDYLSLQRERRGVARDIPQTARQLWESCANAWVGRDSEPHWSTMHPGLHFLNSLVPDTKNLREAKLIFEKWVTTPTAYWDKDFLVNSNLTEHQIRNNEYKWPDTWETSAPGDLWDYYFPECGRKEVCCRSNVTYAVPSNFGDLFRFRWVYSHSTSGGIKDLPETLRSNKNICGIIAHFSVSRFSDVIDLSNAAAIISLVRGNAFMPQGDTEFLDGHIAKWRERSEHDRCGVMDLDLPDDPKFGRSYMMSSVFMHYMRSFIVVNPNEKVTCMKPHAPGLKCLREHITFQGFYDLTETKLIEKRYSTAIRLLPLHQPAGHYALVSIYDGQQEDARRMFERSPSGSILAADLLRHWKEYGIYPAGLYTGFSMFQLEICVFIDSWEQDWISTIKRIDEMVSLRLNVLDDGERLRNLVLGNRADASVLYFKVLQILNNFSDMVRAAPSYLDTLSNNVRSSSHFNLWFEKSYPYTEITRNILQHNWKIVRERQCDASNRILAKLERTTNEVKSLQSGLFNVQSITEARKTRVLNKYLMVFTIVTILFLPPTFVATFFGMHIFDADTIDTTQKIFWLVLGALSGGTYLFAALGLFSSNLSAEERKEWEINFRKRINEKTGNFVAWFDNTQQSIRGRMARVG